MFLTFSKHMWTNGDLLYQENLWFLKMLVFLINTSPSLAGQVKENLIAKDMQYADLFFKTPIFKLNWQKCFNLV